MLYEQVLYILEQKRGQMVTGGEIARQLGVSRTAVWKAVAALREKGSEIESVQGSGYRLREVSDGLSGQVIRDHLTTRMLGRSLEVLDTVSSTNVYLKAQDTAALPEGHVVIADGQTGGRGRMSRTFHSPPHGGIYLTCLLKPPIPLTETPFLTICAAVAVCRAIQDLCDFEADIKWVNDIYHNGKKLCGILTEAAVTAETQYVDYAVVGIGVNTGEVAPEVADIATSLSLACGVRGIRNRLAAGILNRLEEVYLDFTQKGNKEEILRAYTDRLFIQGKQVTVTEQGRSYAAGVLGVDAAGGLIVRDTRGDVRHIYTGEVHLSKEM